MSACLSQNGPDNLTIDRAKRLLALDTGKVWQRTQRSIDGDDSELGDCELNQFYSFISSVEADTAYLVGGAFNCTPSAPDTLGRWSWAALGDIQEQFSDSLELTNSSGAISYRVIRELTSNNLEWQYLENEQEVREKFLWIPDPQF